MRKLLTLFVIAAPLSLYGATACSTFGGGTALNSGPIPIATVQGAGFACTLNDKTFSAFNTGGTIDPDSNVSFTHAGLNYAFIYSGVFVRDFTIAYNVNVDNPGFSIVQLGLDGTFETVPSPPGPSDARVTETTSAGNLTLTYLVPATPVDTMQTNIDVLNTFTMGENGLGASQIRNGFVQAAETSAVPEPATFATLGGALMLVGFAARRRRAKQ